jgi:predicted dehydrogenase
LSTQEIDMPGERLQIGVIGAGLWGARAHIPALIACNGVDVVAVADPDITRAESVAEQFGVTHVFGDGLELLNDLDNLDAVVIATPTDTHHDLVLAACNRGVHILCEKPLAYDVAQAREMVRALNDRGLVGKLGFLFRFSPVIERMKQLIDDGYIGEIQLVEILTINAQFMDPTRPLHWKMQLPRANGGVFVEYGAHSIDLALWLAGPVSRLVAHGVTLVRERPIDGADTAVVLTDDTASWITEHEGGAQGLFRTGWATMPIGGGGLRVYGTSGSLAWQLDPTTREQERLLAATLDQPTPETLLEFTASAAPVQGEESLPLGLLADYNQRLVRSFVDDVRRGQGSYPSFADGFEVQKVLAAIRTSLDQQRWVDLDPE